MSTIPSHYSKPFVHQRFRKALSIVQHYSSSLEPTKDQRLELYALFKQASTGNVNTQRPGIFDVVGRAKWDAWKQLEGLSTLEAKHRYVEAFLRVASEAYRKPSSRAQAQQILQAFATMQPSSIQEESSDDDDDEDDDEYEDDEESSVIAEERAYLRDIQQQRQYYQRRQSSLRPPSAASTQISAITAPSTPLGRPNSAISNRIRRPPVLLQGGDDDSVILDPNVNPWVSSSTKDIDPRQQQQQQQQRRESLLTPSFDPTSPLEHRRESFNRLVSSSSPSYPTAPSPFVSNPSSPARSNITATQEQEQQGTHGTNTSVVSLGPATRRALETLESEIIALNERIDGLKQELRANITNTAPSSSTAPRKKKRTGQWPWRWIVKMALRHTIVHILLLVCFALYMDQSPIALITQIVASQRNRQRAIV